MIKFIISGLIVVCVAMGIIFVKAKRVNNDHEPLLTPLSSIKPQSAPLLKKDFSSEVKPSTKKNTPVELFKEEDTKASLKSASTETNKLTITNPPRVEKKAVLTNGMATLNNSKKSAKQLLSKNTKILNIPLPPKIVAVDNSIQNIQRELQSVIELNEKINIVQIKKTTQLLRTHEQVLIQQKILKDIQRSIEENSDKSTPSREALVAQEKLKIIHEESLKNKKLLEEQDRSKISS